VNGGGDYHAGDREVKKSQEEKKSREGKMLRTGREKKGVTIINNHNLRKSSRAERDLRDIVGGPTKT